MIRWVVKLGLAGLVAGLSVIGLSAAVVADRADGRIFSNVSEIPAADAVIVPGAKVFPDGTPSLTLQDRLDGAEALYRAGVVPHVLVSGDNRAVEYNEPVAMRNALVDAGLPPADVTLDYAGLDTWDTCRRAAEQFGVEQAVVVTQQRYAKRTAALCRAAGIEVSVLAVEPPAFQTRRAKVRRSAREALAKVKATGDVLRHSPARHGGPQIGLVGSVDMPEGGHPPDWDWETNQAAG